ncbi:hypothetical protein SAMN05428962_6390 [Paenibacillus sp. BC26]|nr:hypothetical protein SAMN05428962_6390 [Paenibacillus sp. BC26]
MSRRRRGTMSEELKKELAKDLGFYDTVQKEGWGGIKAKDAGNMVKRAIQIAEQAAAKQYAAQQAQSQSPYQQQTYQSSQSTYRPQPAHSPFMQPQAQPNYAPQRQQASGTVPAYMHQAMQAAQPQASHYQPH